MHERLILTKISEAISDLDSSGYSKEYILDFLVKQFKVFLHGSRINIHDEFLRPNLNGDVFVTNDARIAILRAIFSNRGLISPGLRYPYLINENNPLILRIHGINNNTIGDSGFVYIISDTNGFSNSPPGSWQYVKKNANVPFSDRLEILRSDFTYRVYDVTNSKELQ